MTDGSVFGGGGAPLCAVGDGLGEWAGVGERRMGPFREDGDGGS